MSQRKMLQRDHPLSLWVRCKPKVLKWWFWCTGARLLLMEKLLRARLPSRRAPHSRASHCTTQTSMIANKQRDLAAGRRHCDRGCSRESEVWRSQRSDPSLSHSRTVVFSRNNPLKKTKPRE